MRAVWSEERAARRGSDPDRAWSKDRGRDLQRLLGRVADKTKQLINHFGLDVSNPDSHQFLFDQMKIFFYNEGVEIAQIDTSQEGKIVH